MTKRIALNLALALSATDLHALQRAPEPCDRYEAAISNDPANREAAVRLGQCAIRDYEMIAPGGDSTRLMFRSNWNTPLRALRSVVDLDPAYDRAYRPLFRMLLSETRDGCSFITSRCVHVSSVRRDGDTLVTIPMRVIEGPDVEPYDDVVRESQTNWGPSMVEIRTRAERWAAAAPNDYRPYEYIGRALLRLGETDRAVDALERAAAMGTPASRRALLWERIEALIKTNRGADARRVLDEAENDPQRDTTQVWSHTVAGLNAVVGRNRLPPRPLPDSAAMRRNRERMEAILRARRSRPATMEQSFEDLLAAGDTTGAKRALARLDSLFISRPGRTLVPSVGAQHLTSAEYRLALGDTAGAEVRLAEIDRVLDRHHYEFSWSLASGVPTPWLARGWSLGADVAAARGRPADAARLYRRVIGLWGGGDAELQPVVDRARERLAALP
jgi:tetratricopeptide (TPR) repeat protein